MHIFIGTKWRTNMHFIHCIVILFSVIMYTIHMYTFIINPRSSSGQGIKTWHRVRRYLDNNGIPYSHHILKSDENASSFVKSLNDSPCHIIVLGGDGTLNSVLNGIESFENIRLSCLCTGSGNDFARNMNVAKDPIIALSRLMHSPIEQIIDYGVADYIDDSNTSGSRRFLISCGIGYDADVCEHVDTSSLKGFLNRIRLGKLIYLALGVKMLFTKTQSDAEMIIHGHTSSSFSVNHTAKATKIKIKDLFVTVGMVHKMEGGGIPFCPDADPTDGLFDFCIVSKIPRIVRIPALVLVCTKKHAVMKKYISFLRCSRMDITLKTPMALHMDGDVPCHVKHVTLKSKSGLKFVK